MDSKLEALDSLMNSWLPYIAAMIVGIVVMIRSYMGGPECPSKNKISGRIVLITGASSGLGLVTAKKLAERGAKIILTCRNLEKGKTAIALIKQQTPNAKIDLRELDVSLMSNIKDFVDSLKKDYDHLDILINNAGVISLTKEKTAEGFELTLATNYLGPFLLTHLLLPLLNKSENGRVINISSLAHYAAQINLGDLNGDLDYVPREAYGQSKLALVLFTKHLATLCKKTNITINAINPGIIRDTDHLKQTSLGSSTFKKLSVWPWVWLFLKTPQEACQTVLYLAVDPMLSAVTGEYYSDCQKKEPSDSAKNENLGAKLYQKTCELCDISSTILEDL